MSCAKDLGSGKLWIMEVGENGKEKNSTDVEPSQVNFQLLSTFFTRSISPPLSLSQQGPLLGQNGGLWLPGRSRIALAPLWFSFLRMEAAGGFSLAVLSQMCPSCQGKRSKCLMICQFRWEENKHSQQ